MIGIDFYQTVFGGLVIGSYIKIVAYVVNRIEFRFVAVLQIDESAILFAEIFEVECIAIRPDAF